MPKFHGVVGFGVSTEVRPGIWEDVIVERPYFGDVDRNVANNESGDRLNNELTVTNAIRIVADPYAHENFSSIRYVKWMGALWQIDSVEVLSPRLLLRLGRIYNGPVPKT